MMADEKDRFGDKMRLVERAREDIYFAEKDRELIEKLRASLKKVAASPEQKPLPSCPKCPGKLESCSFMGFLLDRCASCEGLWLDHGELEGILSAAARSPWGDVIRRLLAGAEKKPAKEEERDEKR